MNRYFYFPFLLFFVIYLPHLVYGMEDPRLSEPKTSTTLPTPTGFMREDDGTVHELPPPIGFMREDDGRVHIIYEFLEGGGFNCGPVTTVQDALTLFPDTPVYRSFAAQYVAYENRIRSLQEDGQAFLARWKSDKENNVVALFCEDFGLDRDEAIKKFGIKKLKGFARIYLSGLDKMHRDYQNNLIPKLIDVQDNLSADLFDIVQRSVEGPNDAAFLKAQVKFYENEISNFVSELRVFSTDIQELKKKLGIGEKSLDEETFKYTTFYRYRIGNLILSYNLLQNIRHVVTPFLEDYPGRYPNWEKQFNSLKENDFDRLLSEHLFAEQSNSVKEEDKGRKGKNRRQVNKSHKLQIPKKEISDTTNLTSVRGLSLYEVIEAPAIESASSFSSASSLPPGGYKSHYRQLEERTKIKTHKVSEVKDKAKESETLRVDQISEEKRSAQNIFYAENPDVLERLLRGEKVELNEYLSLLIELVLLNPTVFETVEFMGQHGTHPVFRLWFRDETSYSWEIGQAHGGRFIPQNHTYRKSYRKPFKFLGILETGLKDIREKKCEVEKESGPIKKDKVEKGYGSIDKAKEGADSETKSKKKRNRNRNRKRKKKDNNTPKDQSSNEKEEPESETPHGN